MDYVLGRNWFFSYFWFCSTRYIKHLAESANFKGGTFDKHYNGLIGNRFVMPNVSYTHPLCAIEQKR